ncbi:hypothetical protein H6P81_006743 [Aristolochia fimbriata]|uniref:Uncharacterized protein n=1 Tax=Aristolochia fimbriata TaxID=158543 RepID=A0AAV7EZ22_ARIFI|nr:hypothetical protein H6P81_006743 [Aristolochia fimbriata]
MDRSIKLLCFRFREIFTDANVVIVLKVNGRRKPKLIANLEHGSNFCVVCFVCGGTQAESVHTEAGNFRQCLKKEKSLENRLS